MKCLAILKGDGIGPEVVDAALSLVPNLAEYFNISTVSEAGLEYYERTGQLLSDTSRQAIIRADYLLLGAYTTPPKRAEGCKSMIGYLRTEFDLGVNVRPFKSVDGISAKSFDLVLFRENTEDLYYQRQYMRDEQTAVGEKVITRNATERITVAAFNYARANQKRLITIVTKANVLTLVDGFFREVAEQTLAKLSIEYQYDVRVRHCIVDAAAYSLVKEPEKFEIILTSNLYGDILSDVLAGMMGSLGLCPSVNLGPTKTLFEPIHGSAPDIAGKGIANPTGAILSLANLLRYGNQLLLAESIERAVNATLSTGFRTPDLGGTCDSLAYTQEVKRRLIAP